MRFYLTAAAAVPIEDKGDSPLLPHIHCQRDIQKSLPPAFSSYYLFHPAKNWTNETVRTTNVVIGRTEELGLSS
jgi:hypothetical protein